MKPVKSNEVTLCAAAQRVRRFIPALCAGGCREQCPVLLVVKRGDAWLTAMKVAQDWGFSVAIRQAYWVKGPRCHPHLHVHQCLCYTSGVVVADTAQNRYRIALTLVKQGRN